VSLTRSPPNLKAESRFAIENMAVQPKVFVAANPARGLLVCALFKLLLNSVLLVILHFMF